METENRRDSRIFESKSESLVGSVERKESVTIINIGSSTKARATKRYCRNFTNTKRTKTTRSLKGNLLQIIYYNTVKNMITIIRTKASLSAGRAPKTEEGKYKLRVLIELQGTTLQYRQF